MNIELSEEQKIKILNSTDVYLVMQQVLMRESKIERDFEHFYIVCLSPENKILNIELVSRGDFNQTTLKPMQVFRIAIMKGAARLIIVQNDPTGELKPSDEDKDVTDQMIQAGNIVNVEVLDHLIIMEKYFYSFDDNGLMQELRESTKWTPTFIEIERIKKEALKQAEKKGRKEGRKEGKKIGMEKRNKEIAKKSLKEGLSVELVSNITGLSVEEIEKLIN
jgi:DNA repair protein RadC